MTELRVSLHAVDRFIERIGFSGTRAEAHAEIVSRIGRAIVCGVRLASNFEIVVGDARFVVEGGCVVTTKNHRMARKNNNRRFHPRGRKGIGREIEVEI